MRQNVKRRMLNRQKKSAVRTYEKAVRKFVEQNDLENAEVAYRKFSSSIDKAAKTNLYHKNNAARKKSRLSLLIKKQRQAEPQEANKETNAEVDQTAS